jgi:dipeptidyl aminopeptidase/acylaminoacyl peptidase
MHAKERESGAAKFRIVLHESFSHWRVRLCRQAAAIALGRAQEIMKTSLRLILSMLAGLIVCSGNKMAHAQALSIPHPDDAAGRVEYFLEKPKGNGPWPTVIFLHGHQEPPRAGGKEFVRWGVLDEFAGRGYLAVAISQPGYGNSTGPADFCGPFTQHAVAAVIAKLRAEGYIKENKIVIQGVSRGALVAGLMAAHDPSIRGIVLISGLYDLPAYASRAKSAMAISIVDSMKSETDGTAEALKTRSLLTYAQDIKATALILNGAKDDRTDPDQARRLAEIINARGGHARAIIYPEYGHQIPIDARNKDVDPFIEQVLNK